MYLIIAYSGCSFHQMQWCNLPHVTCSSSSSPISKWHRNLSWLLDPPWCMHSHLSPRCSSSKWCTVSWEWVSEATTTGFTCFMARGPWGVVADFLISSAVENKTLATTTMKEEAVEATQAAKVGIATNPRCTWKVLKRKGIEPGIRIELDDDDDRTFFLA